MKNSQRNQARNKFGQYFTPQVVVDFMISLANLSPDAQILEPACGEGIFVERLQQQGYHNITAYEVDTTLARHLQSIHYQSFVSADIQQRFDLVIGNPPYIRWKNLEPELKEELTDHPLWQTYCNKLCDYLFIFILKSIELLKDQGQLIFICPEYWLNTTHSLNLRNYMVQQGYFETIYHFNETPVFDQATISVVIFKYVKSATFKAPDIAIYKYYKSQMITQAVLDDLANPQASSKNIKRFRVKQFIQDQPWILAPLAIIENMQQFEIACQVPGQQGIATLGEVCEIANGLVSGLDQAFRLPSTLKITSEEKQKLLQVIKGKHLQRFGYETVTPYLFLNEVASEEELQRSYPNFFAHLQAYKHKLEKRYQYQRTIPYWHWVFLRSFKRFSSPHPRIFIPSKERISHKNYFRFSFVPASIYPTQDVVAIFLKEDTRESIYYVLALLNNYRIFTWLKHHGVLKGSIVEFSERPLASIPFRKINWNDPQEIHLHEQITFHCKNYLQKSTPLDLEQIEKNIDILFN